MALFHVSPCVSCSWAATMRNPSELVSCGRRVCDRIASHALDVPLPFVSCLRFRLDSETGVYNKLDTRAVVGVDRPSGLTRQRHHRYRYRYRYRCCTVLVLHLVRPE